MGQQVKSVVSGRRGQEGGAFFDTVKLCEHFETRGTKRIFFRCGEEGRRLVALRLVAGDPDQVEG